MFQFLRIAIRNLIKSRTRSLILGGSIASVTMLLVILMAITSGVQKTMLDNALTLLSGHINIAGFYKISLSSAAPMVTDYEPLDKLARESVPEAIMIIDRLKAYGKLISETDSLMIPMWGVNVARERSVLGRLSLAKKSDYLESSALKPGESDVEGDVFELEKPKTIVIFATQAKKLKLRVGDMLTISMPTYRNMTNTMDVRVVAVLKNVGMMSNFSVFLNAEDTRLIYQMKATSTGQIMIYLPNKNLVPEVENRLRKILAEKKYELMEKQSLPFWMKFEQVAAESWTGQKIDVTTWEDETAFIKWVIDIFHVLTYLLTTVLMIIIVLGLMNTLWMSIKERTNEVGTLRAIGLQRRLVMLMFVIESLVLSFTSTLVGIGAGSLISMGLNRMRIGIKSEAFQMFLMSDVLTFNINPLDLVQAFVIITVFITLGSLIPSYKASKMKPITAINHIN